MAAYFLYLGGLVMAYTGWHQKEDGRWFYYKNDKAIRNDWFKDKDGRWYYFNNDGSMRKGWLTYKNKKCYLMPRASGKFKEGQALQDITTTINGKSYTFDNNCYVVDSLVTDKLVEFIKSWEGFNPKVYKCDAGVSTIGYGTTRKECVAEGTCSKEKATQWLTEDIEVVAKAIKNKNINLKQHEFDALVSFAYNCGTGALFGSTLWKNVKAGVRTESLIKSYFQAWCYGGDKKLPGLYNRRTKEANMFLYADYRGNI